MFFNSLENTICTDALTMRSSTVEPPSSGNLEIKVKTGFFWNSDFSGIFLMQRIKNSTFTSKCNRFFLESGFSGIAILQRIQNSQVFQIVFLEFFFCCKENSRKEKNIQNFTNNRK